VLIVLIFLIVLPKAIKRTRDLGRDEEESRRENGGEERKRETSPRKKKSLRFKQKKIVSELGLAREEEHGSAARDQPQKKLNC
jgi:hypothetical protein